MWFFVVVKIIIIEYYVCVYGDMVVLIVRSYIFGIYKGK